VTAPEPKPCVLCGTPTTGRWYKNAFDDIGVPLCPKPAHPEVP